MPGSSFGGFTEGLSSSIDRQRQDARHEEDKRSAREANILQLLAEHGTPEIQSMALQGLIQSANPKQWKKGLGGYLGQYEPNPAVGQIHNLLSTPKTATRQVSTDNHFEAHSTPMQPEAGPPPMPGQSPEDTTQPLSYHATPPPTLTETYQRPRQALMEPQEERVIGEYKGLVQAYGGGPEAEAQARASIQERYKKAYGHGGAGGRGMQSKAFQGPDGTHYLGSYNPSDGKYYDADTGQAVEGAQPLDKTYRPVYKVLAKPDGRPGLYRIATNGEPQYMQDVPEKAQQIPITNEDGSQTIVPVPPQWSTPGGAPGAAAAAPAGAQTGPPAAPGQAATAPPAGPTTSGAGPSGGIKSKPSPMLSATDNANLGTPMGTHLADVKGRVPLRPEDQQVIQDLDVGLANMARIRELTKALFSEPGGISKRLSGITAGYSEAVGEKMDLGWQRKSPAYAELQGLIHGSLAGAARGNGDKGALSDKDLTLQAQSFPDLGEGWADLPDTKAMALARLDQIEQKMKRTREIYQSGSPAGAGAAGPTAGPPGPGGVPSGGTFKGSQIPGYPPGTYIFQSYRPDGQVNALKMGPE